jgi:phosphatidylserine decarboxylase
MGSIFTLPLSRFLISPLARLYGISLSTYEVPEGGFLTLNDFFVRRTRPDCRLFPVDAHILGSPADACVEIFQNISSVQDFCVKGYHANLEELF